MLILILICSLISIYYIIKQDKKSNNILNKTEFKDIDNDIRKNKGKEVDIYANNKNINYNTISVDDEKSNLN